MNRTTNCFFFNVVYFFIIIIIISPFKFLTVYLTDIYDTNSLNCEMIT